MPAQYLEWAGIWTVACVLGRHVYSQNARGSVYPNLYVLMVGPPGTGKSEAIATIKPFLQDAGMKLCAEHISKASLIDEMGRASVKKITKNTMVDYHSLVLASSEFVQTCPGYDVQFLGMLADWWDCPPFIREAKRHLKEPIVINHPCFNLFAGVPPRILAHSFPSEAWEGGFCSRTILVYVPTQVDLLLYGQGRTTAGKKIGPKEYKDLTKELQEIGNMQGQMMQDSSYIDAYMEWRTARKQPEPKHPRLTYYNIRREHNLEKLAIIAAASRHSMTLSSCDYLKARTWLEGAESNMEDIFIEMGAGDDMALMRDLHAYICRMGGGVGKPVRETVIKRYLTSRIGSQRMDSFLAVAEGAGIIKMHIAGSGLRMVEAVIMEEFREG